MLAAKFILRGEKNFAKIKEGGKRVKLSDLGVSFIKRTGPSLFGFIVPNKISKIAVERNKIKRAMKDSVREALPEIKDGITAVFVAYPSARMRTSKELAEETKEAIKSLL